MPDSTLKICISLYRQHMNFGLTFVTTQTWTVLNFPNTSNIFTLQSNNKSLESPLQLLWPHICIVLEIKRNIFFENCDFSYAPLHTPTLGKTIANISRFFDNRSTSLTYLMVSAKSPVHSQLNRATDRRESDLNGGPDVYCLTLTKNRQRLTKGGY